MMVLVFDELNGFRALSAVFWWFSNRPPWKSLEPPLETVVMSLTPPYSAALFISLTRISAIVPKEGNNSAAAEFDRTLIVLIPSILTESMLGFEPATDSAPALST